MRVLVVDDSTLYRKVVRDALAEIPGIEVVGVAADGRVALEKIESLSPDLVTLDVEMPELDGLGVLNALQAKPERPTVLILSSLSGESASSTAKALRLGAFDVIVKPSGGSLDENRQALSSAIQPVVAEILGQAKKSARSFPAEVVEASPVVVSGKPSPFPKTNILPPVAVLIGISTGGPSALNELLPKLGANFPVPIIIVQHMPPMFTQSLAEQLDRVCQLKVHEAVDGQICRAGEVYIAPGGKQMGLIKNKLTIELQVNNDPPEQSCRPSVNYLFRSAAQQLNGRCLAIVMTGMGDDGLIGGRLLKTEGVTLFAQSEETCTVYGMPRAIVENQLADRIVPLPSLAAEIENAVQAGVLSCS